MIGQLPLFLAVGFCLGLFASPGVVLLFLALQGDGGWRVFLGWAILLSLATLAGVALLRAVDDPGIGLGLQFAALVVGAAGGRWFATASAERDKAVFVAAAGLFLAIAAIEYDYRLFGYLNKFSAGGVDLEFAGPASDKGGDTRVAGASTGPKNDPFSGRNRLNIAIKKLEQLPDFARRDEKYARMFSGYDAMLGKYRLTAPAPEPASKQYQDFYGQFVLPFVQTLEMLHDFHQGEISGISLDTDVIFALRKLYESTLFLAPPNGEAKDFVDKLCRRMDALAAEARLNPDRATEPASCPPPDLPHLTPPLLRDDNASRKYTRTDAYVATAYLAMTSALAEFALDNRERAIALLDDVVVRGSPFERKLRDAKDDLGKTYAADDRSAEAFRPCQDLGPNPAALQDCEDATRHLLAMRRQVARIRMEILEDSIIEVADNPGLLAIRVSLARRGVADMDDVVEKYRGVEAAFDPTGLFDMNAKGEATSCSLKGPGGESRGLAALWIAAATTFRNNALDAAAQRPDVVEGHPWLVKTLDVYARQVESFDADCAGALVREAGVTLTDRLRAVFLETAANYWLAKSQRFGAEPEDDAHLRALGVETSAQIDALCQSDRLFQLTANLLAPATKSDRAADAALDLTARGNDYTDLPAGYRVRKNLLRGERLKKQYAAGDVAKACP